jgi:hypothetical protein
MRGWWLPSLLPERQWVSRIAVGVFLVHIYKLYRLLIGSWTQSGIIRDPDKTRQAVSDQLELALKPRVGNKLKKVATESGVKDSLAQITIERITKLGKFLRAQSNHTLAEIEEILAHELKAAQSAGCENPLLRMRGEYLMILHITHVPTITPNLGVNIHLDTPTEILHTILLGVVKYFWGQTVYVVEKSKKFDVLRARLNSVEQGGLNIPALPVDYICDFKGALIGRHFKAIAQVLIFTIYDLVPRNLLIAWILIGRLTVLLWQTEIDGVKAYLVSKSETHFSQ